MIRKIAKGAVLIGCRVVLLHRPVGESPARARCCQLACAAHANPATRLWFVPDATHVGAYAVAPHEFETQMLAWFQR